MDIDTILKEAINRLDADISLHDKVRSYVVMREICFWKAVAKEAYGKAQALLDRLPVELKKWTENG